jgi:4-amino-4-deoxy-L-arabinose transferase-like glycosyltransferase
VTCPHRALAAVIGISLVLRLAWAATLETGNDEGYHYLFTVYPSLSYFDHPPMTMVIEQIGLHLCGGWVHPFSLRLGFVLLFTASTWILARWTARWFRDWAGVGSALLLSLTPYYFAAAGSFALPDGPFLFFGLLTLSRLTDVLAENSTRTKPWIEVGIFWAGALLSKYHAIFLPAGALLFIAMTPRLRRVLITPGPYLATAIGLIGFVPVLVWNLQNDWASFAFQGSRAIGSTFRPEGLGTMVGGLVAYLSPLIWFLLLSRFLFGILRWRAHSESERFLVCASAVPLAFFLAVSCVRPSLPHWSLIAFVPLYPMAGARLAHLAMTRSRLIRALTLIQITGLLTCMLTFAIHARFGILKLHPDPAAEISGWESVAKELNFRGLVGKPNSFFITCNWYQSGQLAFAIRNRSPVLCYNAGDARGFAYWSRPEEWLGKNATLVCIDNPSGHAANISPYFHRIEPAGSFPMSRNGRPFQTVYLFNCVDQRTPFPFSNKR